MKVLVAALVFIFGNLITAVQANAQTPDLDLEADAAMVVNAEDNQVLYNDNGDEVRPVASLTKMIVQYIVLEEIENGRLNWDEEIHISPFLSELSQNFILANVPLAAEESYTVRQLFEAMSIYSANAATIALAEYIEGSEEKFVYRMRELVESWEIEDAHLVNTTGLHNSFMDGNHISESTEDDENAMSARSALIIASHLIKDHPEVLDVSEEPSLAFPTEQGEFIVENWNKMLPGLSEEYPGVRGLKTGTTEAAGRSFIGYVEGSENLLTIVLNSGDLDSEEDRYRRYEDTAELMDYYLENWKTQTLLTAEDFASQFSAYPVEGGNLETVPLTIESDIQTGLDSNADAIQSITERFYEEKINDQSQLIAPVYEGEDVGEMVIELSEPVEFLNGESYEELTVPIYATETVEHHNWINQIFHQLKTFVQDLFNELALW